jgi:hypothetical protein
MDKLTLDQEVIAALPPEVPADTIVALAKLTAGVTARFGETQLLRAATGQLVVLTRESSFTPFVHVPLRAGAAPRLEPRGFDTVLVLETADGAEHALDVGAFARTEIEQLLGGAAVTTAPTIPSTTLVATASTTATEPASALVAARESASVAARLPASTAVSSAAPAAALPPVQSGSPFGAAVVSGIGFAFVLASTLVPSRMIGILVGLVGVALFLRGASLASKAAKARASAAKPDAPSRPRETTLRDAVLDGALEPMKRLLDLGADPNEVDDDGASLLHRAIEGALDDQTCESVVQLLLSRGANPNVHDEDGETPLIKATQSQNVALMRLLIDRGAELEARDADGCTALRHAIEGNVDDEAAALLLLSSGADALSADNGGRTALAAAKDHEQRRVLSALLARGIQ